MYRDYIIGKCPKCGAEYTVSEIFLPGQIIGKPIEILKDDFGKIIFISGAKPELTEGWTCDICNTYFKFKVNISLESQYDEDKDFSEDFVLKAFSDKEKLF